MVSDALSCVCDSSLFVAISATDGQDHSFMHDDFHAYYAPKDGEIHTTTDYSKDVSAWMKPSVTQGPSNIIVIPGK